jgi:predicted signal transduction protein with EAL and GGDEF domain
VAEGVIDLLQAIHVDEEQQDIATRTAKVLVNTFRDLDILARLGGGEFAALAIEASDHSEATIMARLRESLETVSAQEPRYPLSLSVGVVRFTPRTTRSITELMLQVDRAMYQAKRDQWRSSSPDAFLAHPVSGTKQAALSLDRLEEEPGLGKRDSS